MIAGALAMPVAAQARRFQGGNALLARAMKAMGGRELLQRVKALNWQATAEVHAGGHDTAIRVETRCEPFGIARSVSDLMQASSTLNARTMTITASGGTLQRGRQTTALPAALAHHERQQYGIYGYMLLAFADTKVEGDRLVAMRPGYPPARFGLDADARIVSAEYDVDAPAGGGTLRQRYQFADWTSDRGVQWPRLIMIFQNDSLFFSMRILRFSVELA